MAPDATILTTPPSNLPILPKGSFGVPLTSPDVKNECLKVPGQAQAWDCVPNGFIGLNVTPSDYGSTEVSVYTAMPDLPYFYGAQAPVLKSLSSLLLVNDTYNPDEGPAYFFQQNYDKLVILPPSALSPSSSKRSLDEIMEEASLEDRDMLTSHQLALPGQRPWFCYWNSTTLEGFIYVTQNISDPSQNTTAMVNSVLSHAAAAATQTAQGYQHAAPSSNPSAPTGGVKAKREYAAWPSFVPPAYPKCVKVEERRDLKTAVAPYCQQMQILYNHHINPVANPNGGGPIIVNLTEVETIVQSRDLVGRSRKRDWVTSCSCEWKSE